MEIWLIQNGKKTGPFNDYEIRGRISERQLEADDFAWHEGLPDWVKLREIELFRNEFEAAKRIVPPPLPAHFPTGGGSSESEIKSRYLLRRFWARWLDLMAYLAAWWLLMYVAGGDIKAIILNLWAQLLLFVPWFIAESWLLHKFGTTPGKWLLGIRVVNEDGSNLSLKAAIKRSTFVWIAGLGFGFGFLPVICQLMSFFTTRNTGKPLWDHVGQHKLIVARLSALKITALVILFFVSMQLQTAVRFPHDREILLEDNREIFAKHPEIKKILEESRQWHFPVKD